MSYIPGNNEGLTPLGETQPIPVSGSVYFTTTPLVANDTLYTDWIKHEGYNSFMYVINSDVVSATNGVSLEYSEDGIDPIVLGLFVTTYTQITKLLQSALVPKGKYLRMKYTNGAQNQGYFFLETRLSTSIMQPTTISVNKPVTPTNFATVVKAILEIPDSEGIITQITRSGTSLNVHVDNELSIDQATLAQNTTLTDGTQKTQVTNFPSSTEISNDIGNPIPVNGTISIGNLPVTQPISGSVSVSNFPASVEISNDSGSVIPVSGTVSVSNFPASVEISNDTGSAVPVSGSVSISNLPTIQPVSGTIEITNDIGNAIPVSGSVSVSNFPATQPVSGSVSITGSVEIANDSGNAVPVSAAALPLPTGASTATLQTSGNTSLSSIDSKLSGTIAVSVSGGSTSAKQDTGNTSLANIDIDLGAAADSYVTDPTASGSIIALLKGLLYETPGQATVGTGSSVTVTGSTTQVLASSTTRKGATIFNESGGALFVFLGASASSTLYTTKLSVGGYYEVPYYYTGIITAVSGSTSTVRITSLS